MRIHSPDRGRDLSLVRTAGDRMAGPIGSRTIIQCRYWLNQSVLPSDVGNLRDQMTLWERPRVDVLAIATSGRFASDAVALIERHNQSERARRIEMWPESFLEALLAERPALIAGFGLQ